MNHVGQTFHSCVSVYLATEGSRRLLTTTLPGALWTIYVVEPRDAALNAEVLTIVFSHLFGRQLLKAVGILRLHTHAAPHSIWPHSLACATQHTLVAQLLSPPLHYASHTPVLAMHQLPSDRHLPLWCPAA